MIPIQDITGSSNIDGIGFSPTDRVLVVRFANGGVYHYQDVAPETHAAFLNAESKGGFLRENLIGKYAYSKIG